MSDILNIDEVDHDQLARITAESYLIAQATIQLVTRLAEANQEAEPRLRTLRWLQAMMIFGNAIPGAQAAGLMRPAEQLFQALLDAEDGVMNPLLERSPRTRRDGQATPDRKKILQVWAAALVEVLRLDGEPLEPAARAAARLFGDIQIPGKISKGRLWNTILEWRQNLEGYGEKDPAVRARYQRVVSSLRPHIVDQVMAAHARLSTRDAA